MPALLIVAWRFFAATFRSLKQPEFQALAISVVTTVAVGIWFYMRFEGWTFVDALYFTIITLTTVGYGDISPQTAIGKIFTVFYILLGLGLIAAFIAALAGQLTENAKERGNRRQQRKENKKS